MIGRFAAFVGLSLWLPFAQGGDVAGRDCRAASKEIILDEDNDHFFKYPSNQMTVARLEAYVDQIAAGGKVTRINWCPTGGRASFDSKTWEPIWTGLKERPLKDIYWRYRDWAVNAKILNDKGIDPYAVFLRRSREKGISPWISPRMNDCHDAAQGVVDKRRFFRSISLWRERPDLRFYPDYKKPSWGHHKLNYAKAEVRENAMEMIRELFERYDFDGINLQKGPYFPKEIAVESTPIFTAFMRDIRRLCDEWGKRRGHRIGITLGDGGRTIADFVAQGIDIVTLANERILDGVIGVSDFAAWRRQIANPDFRLYATTSAIIPGPGKRPDGRSLMMTVTAAMHRARADCAWAAGADGIMTYNVEYQPDDFFQVCRYGLAPEDLAKHSRVTVGRVKNGGTLTNGLAVVFTCGATTNGQVSAVLGFKDKWAWGLEAKLNGIPALFEDDSHLMHDLYCENREGCPFVMSVDKQARRLFFPEGTAKPGLNVLEVAPVETDAVVDMAELRLEP